MTDLSGTFGWGVLASWVAPSWACGTKITPCLIFTLLDLAYNLCVFHPIWEEACTNLAGGWGKEVGRGGGKRTHGWLLHSFIQRNVLRSLLGFRQGPSRYRECVTQASPRQTVHRRDDSGSRRARPALSFMPAPLLQNVIINSRPPTSGGPSRRPESLLL